MNRGTRLKISASRDAGKGGEPHACSGNGSYFEPERTDRGPRPAKPADGEDRGLSMVLPETFRQYRTFCFRPCFILCRLKGDSMFRHIRFGVNAGLVLG